MGTTLNNQTIKEIIKNNCDNDKQCEIMIDRIINLMKWIDIWYKYNVFNKEEQQTLKRLYSKIQSLI